MVDKAFIITALKELDYDVQEGDVEIRGYGGQRTKVELRINTRSPGYDIGFRKSGENYELVADWWGIKDINKDTFMQQLNQKYAYSATLSKLEEKGFSIAKEDVEEGNKIHLVLRRMV
jgi:hypothetical protein